MHPMLSPGTPNLNHSYQKYGTYEPVIISKCIYQSAADRFGEEGRAVVRERENNLQLEMMFGSMPNASNSPIYDIVPRMQSYRNNLMTLSQTCNLCFVGYQGKIYVYRPRGAVSQHLPKHPDLILAPAPSAAGSWRRGLLDPLNPHAINHLKTGYLGEDEVVVSCHDDGDVIAYYVRDIAAIVLSRKGSGQPSQSSSKHSVQPLLHENVGHSTWGLAIHQKSCLIAVSSNRHEITILACSLRKPNSSTNTDAHQCDCATCCPENSDRVRLRARDWTIVVVFGDEVENIPNICFISDEKGEAEKVLAIDIGGNAWILNIWKSKQPATRVKHPDQKPLRSEEFYPGLSKGWGIAVIPEAEFLTVKTQMQLTGAILPSSHLVRPNSGCRQPMMFFEASVLAVPEHPMLPELPFYSRRLAAVTAAILDKIGLVPPPWLPRPVSLTYLTDCGDGDVQATDFSPEDLGIVPTQSPGLVVPGLNLADPEDEGRVCINGLPEFPPHWRMIHPHNIPLSPDSSGSEAVADGSNEEMSEDEYFGVIDANGEDESTSETSDDSSDAMELDPAANSVEYELSDRVTNTAHKTTDRTEKAKSDSRQPAEALRSPSSTETKLLPGVPQCIFDQTLPKIPFGSTYFPHSGQITEPGRSTSPKVAARRGPPQHTEKTIPAVRDATLGSYAGRYHLLRAFEHEIELRDFLTVGDPPDGKHWPEIGLLFSRLLPFGKFGESGMRPLFFAAGRINMIERVPELSLIVVGSPTGRVALITPTKYERPVATDLGPEWSHGFRVERVLPRRADELAFRRKLRPLHGMAISPIQQEGQEEFGREAGRGEAGVAANAPRRYRLMLHYRNHDILTYEISRKGQMNKLCIF